MYALLHTLLTTLYQALAPAAVVADVLRARRAKDPSPSGSLVLSILIAVPVGVTVPLLYAWVVGGRLGLWQLAVGVYLSAGLLLLLRAFDGLLRLPGVLLARRW